MFEGQPGLNPLTLRGDYHVNSPHNFNEMLVTQVLRMKIIISLRCDIDITTNSHDFLTKKSMVRGGRMNDSILYWG